MSELKKIPLWAWAAIALVVVLVLRRRSSGAAATLPAAAAAAASVATGNTGIVPPGMGSTAPASAIDTAGALASQLGGAVQNWLPLHNSSDGTPIYSPRQLPDPDMA